MKELNELKAIVDAMHLYFDEQERQRILEEMLQLSEMYADEVNDLPHFSVGDIVEGEQRNK